MKYFDCVSFLLLIKMNVGECTSVMVCVKKMWLPISLKFKTTSSFSGLQGGMSSMAWNNRGTLNILGPGSHLCIATCLYQRSACCCGPD